MQRIPNAIALTYDPLYKQDGTGAQIQRQLAVRILAKMTNQGYVFSEFLDISVHPLDPFQTEESYRLFLQKLNNLFLMPGSTASKWPNVKNSSAISISRLLLLAIQSKLFKNPILLKIGEPYGITEYFPEYFVDILEFLPNWPVSELNTEFDSIGLHYRQGVGGSAIYPGQQIPREIEITYFLTIIQQITKDKDSRDFEIKVLTDAPKEGFSYKPPENQMYLWEGTPGFENGELRIKGFDFSQLEQLCGKLEINSGGDPIEAIRIMSSCDYLIMGRSSLSYVGALLNAQGIIFYPSGFWHKSLPNWRVVS